MKRTFTKYPSNYVKASKELRLWEVQNKKDGSWVEIQAYGPKEAVELVAGEPVILSKNDENFDYITHLIGSQKDKYKMMTGSYGRNYCYRLADKPAYGVKDDNFISEIPYWLEGQPIMNYIRRYFKVDEAQFYDEPVENSIPIYLLSEVYGIKQSWRHRTRYPEKTRTPLHDFAYSPDLGQGIYDDIALLVDGRYMSLKNVGHIKTVTDAFNNAIEDVSYLVAPRR